MQLNNHIFEPDLPHCRSYMTTRNTAFKSFITDLLTQGHLIKMKQVHSENVVVIDQAPNHHISSIPYTDALITNQKNVILSVKVADCCPILISHSSGWIAAIHAGRRGTQQHIFYKTLKTLQTLTNDNKHFTCWLGPCLCSDCHEINPETHQCYDLHSENKHQFESLLSYSDNQLIIASHCTACSSNHHFFSYRKNNKTLHRNYCFIHRS